MLHADLQRQGPVAVGHEPGIGPVRLGDNAIPPALDAIVNGISAAFSTHTDCVLDAIGVCAAHDIVTQVQLRLDRWGFDEEECWPCYDK